MLVARQIDVLLSQCFQTLPEQQHCYFVTENRNLDGVVVSSIPFTHPAHVAQILNYLRQQALFNTLIMSCIRPNSKQGKRCVKCDSCGSLIRKRLLLLNTLPWVPFH